MPKSSGKLQRAAVTVASALACWLLSSSFGPDRHESLHSATEALTYEFAPASLPVILPYGSLFLTH
jgi:hypothetical protein